MPLSEQFRQFLQNLPYAMMSPEQQADARARSQQAQQQQQFESSQGLSREEMAQRAQFEQDRQQQAEDAMRLQLFLGGAFPAQQQAPGGASLNATSPSMMESPQPTTTPRATGPQPPGDITDLAPWLSMFGMQGAPSQTPGAANAVPSGDMSPSSRMAATGATSGGGAVISPADPSSILPTVASLGRLGNWQLGPKPAKEPTFPYTFTGEEPGMTGLTGQKTQMNLDQLIKMMEVQQKGEKSVKTSKEEDLQTSAAQSLAKELGLKGTFNKIGDLPIEHQTKGWQKFNELTTTEQDRLLKEERTQNLKDRAEKYSTQKASDDEALADLRRDPMAWFDVKKGNPDQAARLRIAAAAQGLRLPTREYTTQLKDSILIADQIQMQTRKMIEISKILGPSSFGAMIGRLKNAEGEWGSPAFTDPARASLEQEFRHYATQLTAQEAKLVGGGRSAVMIYNALKNATPQQKMDYNSMLQGAFRQVLGRSQMTKEAAKRYAYGDIENPYTDYAKHRIGEIITTKDGRRGRITTIDPKTGDYTAEPVQ